MTDLRALLKRLEELEGPDREVDMVLDTLVVNILPHGSGAERMRQNTRYYTHSIDAALALAQSQFPNDVTDFLRASVSAEAKRHNRHVAFAPFDVSELARGVLIEMVKELIAKAEAEEGVGEF